jgi:hypothetical protein
MASAKSILEKMIAAMNRGGDAAILKAKDVEMFAKPRPKKKPRVLKKSPPPLRKNRDSKARKKPRKKTTKESRRY